MVAQHQALSHFVRAYVNDDWPFSYGDVWAAVDDFVRGAPSDARLLPAEIQHVLTDLDDQQLQQMLHALGLGYLPESGEGGYRGWLAEVSRRVAAATAGQDTQHRTEPGIQ